MVRAGVARRLPGARHGRGPVLVRPARGPGAVGGPSARPPEALPAEVVAVRRARRPAGTLGTTGAAGVPGTTDAPSAPDTAGRAALPSGVLGVTGPARPSGRRGRPVCCSAAFSSWPPASRALQRQRLFRRHAFVRLLRLRLVAHVVHGLLFRVVRSRTPRTLLRSPA
ncbi:hypothetical protein ACFQ3Z_18770 [Streptomyces nogalater]